METITSVEDFRKIVENNPKVLVDFSAVWCPPCKKFTPTLEEVTVDFKEVKTIKIDIDDVEPIADEFNISAVPTLILLQDGKEVARQEGAVGKAALKTWITKSLK